MERQTRTLDFLEVLGLSLVLWYYRHWVTGAFVGNSVDPPFPKMVLTPTRNVSD